MLDHGELPEHLLDRLTQALVEGLPIRVPQPSQARYARLVLKPPSPLRRRALTVIAAAAALILVAAAAPQGSRQWVVESVSNIARQVGTQSGLAPRSTRDDTRSTSPAPEKRINAGAAVQSPAAAASPKPSDSPESTQSPEPDTSSPSPTPEASDGSSDEP